MGLGVWLNYFLIFRKLWQNIFNTFRAKMYQIMLGQPKYIFCFRFLCKFEVLSSFSCKSEVLSSLLWKFEVLSFSISFFDYGSCRNRSCREGKKKDSFCAHDFHLVVRLAMSGFGGGALQGLLSNLSSPIF
jgi:hypothetical protein